VKPRPGPLVALVLLVGLGVYVYFQEFRGAEGRRKAEESKDRPLPFERAGLKALEITNPNGTFRLEKDGEAWKLTAPVPADADKDSVEGLLSSLEMARIERRLGAGADLKGFGLDPPKVRLKVEPAGGGDPAVLALGEENPIGGTWFALLPDGKEVAILSSAVGDLARKDLIGLRDKTLVAFEPWKLKRLRIERGRERITLAKPKDDWKIEEPIEAPADGTTVGDLLSEIERLKAKSFAAENPGPADLRRFGLQPPAARLSLLQEGWDVEKSLVFGRETDGGRYARAVGRDPVVTVPADIWPKVTTRVFDLRRKDLLAVNQYRVETISAARDGRPALVLTRQKDQSWTASGLATGKVKADSVDILLRMFSDLKALSFADRPSEALRDSFLRRPALDLVLTEEAPADGGTPKSQHLVVSQPDKAGRIKVRDMAWRPIAAAHSATLEKIHQQLDAMVQEASAPPAPEASPAPSPSPAAE
jgi:hypothetical protein